MSFRDLEKEYRVEFVYKGKYIVGYEDQKRGQSIRWTIPRKTLDFKVIAEEIKQREKQMRGV